MSTLSKLAQFNNENKTNDLIAKNGSSSTLAKLSGVKNNALYAQQVNEAETEETRAKNNGGFFGGIGYAFEKLGLGILSSLEGIWDYTAGGLAKLFGADDWAEQQFANDWVDYNHADDWYNPSDGWKLVGDVAGGIGSSLPSMAALAAVSFATGGAAVPAMITTFLTSGLSAAGNATKEAYRETGELGGKEFGYGALSGLTEGTVETFSDMVLGGVGGQIRKAFNKDIVSTVAKKTLGKEIAKSFLSEGFEEVVGTITEPYWKRLTYDKDAENATFQEIGYAALVGGLSGAIMTGIGGGCSNARSIAKGVNVVNSGTTSTVLQQAQSISTFESQNHTENEVFEAVNSTYNELQQSLEKTNGKVETVKQKMLLGRLQNLNTQAIFQPIITKSAENIYNNAKQIAERMTAYGYKDANGKPITITAEQIREGIDTTSAKTFKKSMVSALKSNSVLRTLSVIDATGQIMLDTAKYKEAALTGQKLSSQVDLNRFIETATDSELKAVGEKLGIDNWQGLTSSEFQEKITEFARNGGVEAYKNERLIVKDADNISADTAQKLPNQIDMQENGIKRYYLGDSQVAVIKDGDNYRIYDYSSKRLSKVLTKKELNNVLKQLNTQEKNVADSVKQQLESDSELKRQAAEIDEFARENISEYKTLNAPNQSMIRQIIRNGRAAGVSEDFVLTTARVSARSGLNIVFSKEASFVTANGTYADGAIDLKNNQIIINPEAKNRTGEMILIHELTHAIYNLDGGVLQVAEGLKSMSDAEKNSIRERYVKIGKGSAVEVSDEINAHFAEQTLANKNVLERLVAKKPTLKEKILNFFKKSSVDYSEDAKLTGAAKKLFKQYQKLFNDFSARNKGTNATEISVANSQTNAYALAKDDNNSYNNQKGAVDYGKETSETNQTESERYGLDNIQGRQRANQISSLRDFSRDSQKARLESKADRLEYLKILKKGGYTQVKIDNMGVNNFISYVEVKEEALLPVLKDIRAENKKIGFKTKYTVSGFNVSGDSINYDNALGLYSPSYDTIYLRLFADEDITNTNNHERLHNVERKYPDLFNAFKAEVKQLFGKDYNNAVESVAKDWGLADFSLKESEFLAEFFAGGERIDFGFDIDVKRDVVVEKYRKLLAKKGNLDNLRYALPETDSNGNKLSKEQREYFADSKVIDKNGKLCILYHGTDADFTVFDNSKGLTSIVEGGLYFTKNKQVAESFSKAKENKGRVVEAYLNITGYLDLTNMSRDYISDVIEHIPPEQLELANKRGIRVDGGFTFADLANAVYKRYSYYQNACNVIEGWGYDGIKQDSDTFVAFHSNQIKETSNINPTIDNDIRYALDSNEDIKNLVAVHNITESKLLQSIKIGGLAVPSIAITDVNYGHENFGNISLIFRKETISPTDRRNKVFSSDAYSKRFPSTVNKISEKNLNALLREYDKAARLLGTSVSTIESDLEFTTKENAEYLLSRTDFVKYQYLTEQGINIEMKKKSKQGRAGLPLAYIEEFANKHKEIVDRYNDTEVIDRLTPEVTKVYNKMYSDYGLAKDKSASYKDVDNFLYDVAEFNNKGKNAFIVDDISSFSDDIDARLKGHEKEFQQYVKNIVDKYYEDTKYFRNNNDLFTNSGNRRPFDSLYTKATLENLVSYMTGKVRNEEGYNYGTGSIRSVLSKQFTSIEDIKKSSNRLVNTETMEQLKKVTDTKTFELAEQIAKLSNESNSFIATDTALDLLVDIAKSSQTNSRIISLFNEYYGKIPTQSLVAEIQEYMQTLREYPTEYFEAKPQRAVGFNEVVEVIAPVNTSPEIIKFFQEQGIKIELYDENTNKRSALIKNLPDDIRFALQEDEDNGVVGGLTKAQRAKFVANNTKLKVYSKSDAEVIINNIIADRLNLDERYVASLTGKSKAQAIDYLFKQLNGANEGYRGTMALKIADYIIENATMEDMWSDYSDVVDDIDRELVSYMNNLRHKFDLKGIKGEIKYKFDTKNGIFMQWAAKNGGFGADQVAHEMEDMGLHTFTAINEADQFFEMIDAYNAARERLNKKIDKQMLSEYGDQTKLDNLKQQIVRDILLAYDEKGSQSKYGKLVEKYTQKISSLRQQVKDVYERNLITNNILDKAQKMKDLKLGTFLNATDFKSDIFKQSIESLAKIKNRGNLNNAGTHRVIANLRQWYTMENPLLENNYNDDVAFMLDTLSQAKKNYSTTELKMLRDVMSYFVNFVENYNRVYKQGKWIDAIPEAERYINTIHDNEKIKVGIFGKLTGSAYMQTFGDPMTVARRMDRYESNGFYTEMMTELRNAAVDSEIAEMEVKSDYNDFLSSHKKYLAEIKNTKVNFNGVDIPKAQLISLYLTMKRSHSNAGLVLNGFAFVDNDGKRVRVKGFAPSVMTDADILTSIADTKIEIEKHFTDADMQYISILEKAFNKDAKKLKADRDMQRLGFTNATEDYYYPIRRGNIAKNIDTSDISAELDRVSNSSFNKDTIKGAKQELFIESADTVFNRHIKAVTKYAYLSPAIETFNRLYNLDISGNKNKPVSVSTESTNTWSKANRYFSKLISDIQGIPTTSSEGMKFLRFLRSCYAKFQLGANPKVWVTQLSSLFASSSMLDTDCIIKGMAVSAKDVDTYCSLAKLRNSNNTVAMAQGVLDKLGKFSDKLMAPIGKMDRFVVKRLFGACQVQVQKNGGAKIGTVENKVEAGKMLRQVILETQQNSMATERSAAMRSGNEIMRTITMFSADSMKVVGRVIDSVGELSTLKAKLKITTDSTTRTKILSQIKLAKNKVRKSVIALITSAAFMAGVAKLFRWLYRKDDDENTAEAMTVDFIGNLFGGLPVLKEIYGRFAEGYDIDNYAYSAINDLLDSVQDIYQGVEKIASGKIAEEDIGKTLKKLAFSAGQVLGIPTRNMYNILYGLTKRVSPTTAYLIDTKMYKKNYVSDLNKAIENDDTAMINLIMSIILDKRVGNEYSEVVVDNLKRLYSAGYSVLPKSIGGSVTYNGESIELTSSQQKYFKSIYNKANASVEKMILDRVYKNLSEEKQAKAIKNLYDAYYSKALSETLGVENDNKLLKMSKYISIEKLAAINAGLSAFSSDKDRAGKAITGSKRNKIIKYLLNQSLTDEQRLLILAFQGYTMKDREYRGWTAAQVKNRLLRYILGLKSATVAEKSELAQLCGFEVKNGKIIPQSPYSKNK